MTPSLRIGKNATSYLVLVLCSLLYTGCRNPDQSSRITFAEHTPSFFDLRHGDWAANTWIRNPENLIMVHESFKQYGYLKLLEQIHQEPGEFVIGQVYVKKNFQQWADSLERTYTLGDAAGPYYQGFWKRRKAEGNDSIVYHIIREFNALTTGGRFLPLKQELVNDTLVSLLDLELGKSPWTRAQAHQAFNRLKGYGMYQSAYNLLYERPETAALDLNRDSLQATLSQFTSSDSVYPWLSDLEK